MNYYITVDGAIAVIFILLGTAALFSMFAEKFAKDDDHEK